MFRISLRIYALIAFVIFNFNNHAQNKVQDAIELLIASPTNKSATISFKAIDLESGNEIASYKSSNAIPSASTTKLFSTATAFEMLGSDFVSQTGIYTSGNIGKDSILYGNVYVKGAGDVSLGSKYFYESGKELYFLNRWSDSLISKGIKKINGAIICDGSDFGYDGTPKSWNWNDIGNYYAVAAQGINFYDNTIKIYFKTLGVGKKSQIIEIFPNVKNLKFKNDVSANKFKSDNVVVYGGNYSLNRITKGSLPCNNERFEVKGSMPDPEFQLADEWVKTLRVKGLIVRDGALGFRTAGLSKIDYTKSKQLLFFEKSKTLKEIAYWTNVKSVNLFAEGILNSLGFTLSGNGSTNKSIVVLKNFWSTKISLDGFQLKDGSGLSRENAISANHFCDLLKYMHRSKNYADFKSTLPVAGVSGTLKNLCKGQAGDGRIYAKSGTISKVKSYAGYVFSKSGKNIAFAITVNNFSGSTSQVLIEIEKVLNELANY